MTVLARIAAAFVEPASAGRAHVEASHPPAWAPPVAIECGVPAVAVLCRARDVRLAGGAAGLALLRHHRPATVVVIEWGGEPPRTVQPLGTPAVARLARTLCEHGLEASPAGRLVRVRLADDELEAVREATLVADEVTLPRVLVIGGPRGDALDDVLQSHAAGLVAQRAEQDPGFDQIAVDELLAAGVRAESVDLTVAPPLGAPAAAGLALLGPLRERFATALRATCSTR